MTERLSACHNYGLFELTDGGGRATYINIHPHTHTRYTHINNKNNNNNREQTPFNNNAAHHPQWSSSVQRQRINFHNIPSRWYCTVGCGWVWITDMMGTWIWIPHLPILYECMQVSVYWILKLLSLRNGTLIHSLLDSMQNWQRLYKEDTVPPNIITMTT